MTSNLHEDGSEIFIDLNVSLTHDDETMPYLWLSQARMSPGDFDADSDLVDEPIGRSGGVLFNEEVEMLLGDGTIKKIPLNTDGFYSSRQYESDPLDFGGSEDISISLGGDSNNDLFAKEMQQAEDTRGSEKNVNDDDTNGHDDGYNSSNDGPTQQQQQPNNLNQHASPTSPLQAGLGNHVMANAARMSA